MCRSLPVQVEHNFEHFKQLEQFLKYSHVLALGRLLFSGYDIFIQF